MAAYPPRKYPAQKKAAVPGREATDRLDRMLAARTGLSRTRLKALILDGAATVGDRTIRDPGYRVNAGETVAVAVPEPEAPEPEGENIPLDIVYEDDEIIVIDKPAGLVVHPGHGHAQGTLVHALAGKIAGGDPERPGIVHRLDRDTSGLMVVARSEAAHTRLQELVRGRPRSRTGRVEAAIGRDRGDPTRISMDTDSPRDAITHFEVEQLWPGHALLRVKLETGRMHQIRVHLAAIDLPVVGDRTYGVPGAGLQRQFLHAAELSFPHPFSDERIEARSDLPPDLAAALETFD